VISDLIYRWIYREEIRERQERGAAVAAVWRQRQVENDRHQAEVNEWWHATRARLDGMSADEKLSWIEDPYADYPAKPAHWGRDQTQGPFTDLKPSVNYR
jgi:hypothetical protein